VRTGKTTSALVWKQQKSAEGIFQPVVDGKRFLFSTISNALRQLENDTKSDTTIEVGNFLFEQTAFDWANSELQQAYHKDAEWLIIDEFGKLELNEQGIYPAIRKILESEFITDKKILFLVRDTLIDQALEKLKFPKSEVNLLYSLID
jgi:nucleoside-triphosphatase THEP1